MREPSSIARIRIAWTLKRESGRDMVSGLCAYMRVVRVAAGYLAWGLERCLVRHTQRRSDQSRGSQTSLARPPRRSCDPRIVRQGNTKKCRHAQAVANVARGHCLPLRAVPRASASAHHRSNCPDCDSTCAISTAKVVLCHHCQRRRTCKASVGLYCEELAGYQF